MAVPPREAVPPWTMGRLVVPSLLLLALLGLGAALAVVVHLNHRLLLLGESDAGLAEVARQRGEALTSARAREERALRVALRTALEERSLDDAVRASLRLLELGHEDERLRLGMLLAHLPRLLKVTKLDAPARQMELSPDGTLLAVVCQDGTVRIGDMDNAETLVTLPLPPALEARFSLDGKWLFVAAGSEGVLLWDIVRGQSGGSLAPGPATGLALSASGERLLVVSETQTRVLCLESRRALGPALTHEPGPFACRPALSADGRAVALLLGGQVEVRVVATGHRAFPPLACAVPPGALLFRPDGGQVLAFGPDGTRSWSAHTGRPVFHLPERATSGSFTADSSLLALFGPTGARLLQASSGLEIYRAQRAAQAVADLSPDGCLLAVANPSGGASLWDRSAGTRTALPHPSAVRTLAFSADARHVVTAGDEELRLWAVPSSAPREIEVSGDLRTVAFTYDNEWLLSVGGVVWAHVVATGAHQDTIKEQGLALTGMQSSADGVWVLFHTAPDAPGARGYVVCDLQNGQRLGGANLGAARPGERFAVAFSPEGAVVAHATGPGPVKRVAVKTGLPAGPDLPVAGPIRALAFSPDGSQLAVCGERLSVHTRGKEGQPFPSVEVPTNATLLTFSPDSQLLAVAGDREARIFNTATGERVGPPIRHRGCIRSCVFSPNGRWVLTASEDGDVRLRAVRDDREGPVFAPGPGPLHHAAFSPDGRWVVATGRGETHIWNALSGLPLVPSLKHPLDDVAWVAFSPDGEFLSGAAQGRSLLWGLPVWDRPAAELVSALQARDEGDVATGRALVPKLFHVTKEDRREFHKSRLRQLSSSLRLALPHLEALVQLDAGRGVLIQLVVACRNAERWQRGLEVADQLLQAHPEQTPTRWLRGTLLLGAGRPREALAEFDAVLAAGIEDAATQVDRGRALMALGRWQESDRAIWRGFQLQKVTGADELLLGALSSLVGGNESRYHKTCGQLADLLHETPSEEALVALAPLLPLGPARVEQTGSIVQRALRERPNAPRLLFAAGLMHLQAGEFPAGLALLQRCLVEGDDSHRVKAQYALAIGLPLEQGLPWLGRAERGRRALRPLAETDHAILEVLQRRAVARYRP